MPRHTSLFELCPTAVITRVFNRPICSICLVEVKALPMVQTNLADEVKQAELFAYFDDIAASVKY